MSMVKIDWKPGERTLRQFGGIGLVAFAAFAALIHWDVWTFARFPDHPALIYTLLGLAAYCGLFALIAPAALKWLYLGLSLLGYPIGFVASYIVLGIFFFLVITPIGLFFRLIGRDTMNRRFDPQAATYWIPRKPPATVKRYFRQF